MVRKNKKFASIILSVLMFSMLTGCSKKEEPTVKSDINQSISATNSGKKLNVETGESKIEWIGKKPTGQHNGTINISKGGLSVDNGKLTGGNFDIDFTTIKVTDIQDPESNLQLTSHLKSEDFFSSEKFPLGKFELTNIAPLPDGNYIIGGKLTIKDISKDVTFPAKININADRLTGTAEFKIDRTLWDIKFKSGKFYENLGDKLISDDMNIKLTITAK